MPSTTWTIPIDGSKKAIGPFPFKVRSITIENRCTAGNIWAVDDRGAQYEATPLTAVQSKAEDTTYLTVYCDAPQAVGAASIIISDSEPLLDVSTSQLTSQATAAAGSNVIVPTVALASFPPAAPVDGQLVAIILPAAFDPVGGKPVRWFAQYDATNALWHVTGSPLYAEVQTVESTANGAYGDLATVGPTITLPRAGDYVVDVGATIAPSAGNTAGRMSYAIGAGAPADGDGVRNYENSAIGNESAVSRSREKAGLAATTLTAKYKSDAAANQTGFYNRWLRVTPLRIT